MKFALPLLVALALQAQVPTALAAPVRASPAAVSCEIRDIFMVKRNVANPRRWPKAQWVNTRLTEKYLREVLMIEDSLTSLPMTQFTFNSGGARLLQRLTRDNSGKHLGFFLNGKLLMPVRVESEIIGGTAMLTGFGTLEETEALVKQINDAMSCRKR